MHTQCILPRKLVRERSKYCALLSAIALSMLAAEPAQAIISATCTTAAGWSQFTGAIQSIPCSDERTFPGDTQRGGSATSDAGLGVLKASADVGFDASELATVDAHSYWQQDGVVINPADPALLGQAGVLYFKASVHGALDATGSGQARAVVNAYAGSTLRTLVDLFVDPGNPGLKTVDAVREDFFPIIFGQPFNLTLRLDVLARRFPNLPGIGSAHSAFFGTAYWGGISKIIGPDGNELADYILSVPGGFDLASAVAPVPLPPAVWLFATGLFVVFGRRTLYYQA